MTHVDAYDAFCNGTWLLEAREYRQAAVALERAKALEPDKGSIREALGRAYLSSRSYRRAAEEFAAAVELSPTDGYAHTGWPARSTGSATRWPPATPPRRVLRHRPG